MPTNSVSGLQRCLAASLTLLLVMPPGDAFALGHKKKKLSGASSSSLSQDQQALHALNRLTFGPRPGDVAMVETMGLENWIDAQLHPEKIDDAALDARLAAYPAMRLSQHDLVERFPSPAMIRQAEQGKRAVPANPVERAIYSDQIAALRERQQKKREEGTGFRVQSALAAGPMAAPGATPGTLSSANVAEPNSMAPSQDSMMAQSAPMAGEAGADSNPMVAHGGDMAPPPPPDMMPMTPPANPPAPPIEEQERKLYADLDATNLVNLPRTSAYASWSGCSRQNSGIFCSG